ncbi:hypothetical protein M9H77_20409 [Catharanthus roseus]|uniref:Uncharacterized protein n=1 Tax=Catharanthus roseus TaxID=4058 RepID=A0ACC0AKG4_CATRO|nr:hypothetical protein M9H77_20409 [Catharanthus roseus]
MYFMKLKSHVNLFNCDFPYVLKQDNHTTWTNQQHNNYLNYLEMSFVKQLQSMGSLSWTSCQSDGRPSQKQFADFNRSSEQFTVPQDSEFPKLNIGKSCAADMAGSRKSPRTHCLRQASKVSTAYSDIQECHEFHGKEKQLKGKKTCSCGSASYSERNYLCYSSCQNSVGSIREGTGQNFVDEDQEQNPSIVSRSKGQKLL